ncbi:MAG TPA: hypothetical protein VFQ80_02525 [Thermomicrobiales bacterium]|jgi:hypothetical protein|nr:hypothetical protein [Thermomicrobiales bacterium]
MESGPTTRATTGGKRRGFKRAACVVVGTPVILVALQACGGTAVAPTAVPATTATVAPTVAPPPTVVSDMTQTAPTIVAAASQVASAVASPIASPLASPVATPLASPMATPAG